VLCWEELNQWFVSDNIGKSAAAIIEFGDHGP
jgi:hypothetical protein